MPDQLQALHLEHTFLHVQHSNVTPTEPQMMTHGVPLMVLPEMMVPMTMTEQEMGIQMMNQTMKVLTSPRMIQTIPNMEWKTIWHTPLLH